MCAMRPAASKQPLCQSISASRLTYWKLDGRATLLGIVPLEIWSAIECWQRSAAPTRSDPQAVEAGRIQATWRCCAAK